VAATIVYVSNSDVQADVRHRNISYDISWSGTYASSNASFAGYFGVTSVANQVEQVIFGDRSTTLGNYIPIWDPVNTEVRLYTAVGTELGAVTVASGTKFRATFIIQP
jgi:hypothetical protein